MITIYPEDIMDSYLPLKRWVMSLDNRTRINLAAGIKHCLTQTTFLSWDDVQELWPGNALLLAAQRSRYQQGQQVLVYDHTLLYLNPADNRLETYKTLPSLRKKCAELLERGFLYKHEYGGIERSFIYASAAFYTAVKRETILATSGDRP